MAEVAAPAAVDAQCSVAYSCASLWLCGLRALLDVEYCRVFSFCILVGWTVDFAFFATISLRGMASVCHLGKFYVFSCWRTEILPGKRMECLNHSPKIRTLGQDRDLGIPSQLPLLSELQRCGSTVARMASFLPCLSLGQKGTLLHKGLDPTRIELLAVWSFCSCHSPAYSEGCCVLSLVVFFCMEVVMTWLYEAASVSTSWKDIIGILHQDLESCRRFVVVSSIIVVFLQCRITSVTGAVPALVMSQHWVLGLGCPAYSSSNGSGCDEPFWIT